MNTQQQSKLEYVGRQQLISVTGNGKTISLKQCKSKFLLSGNANIVDITDSHIELNLVGNGNNITLNGTSSLKIGIDGNCNQIVAQDIKEDITVKYNNGFNNILPTQWKKSASKFQQSEVSIQRNKQAENLATQLRIRQELKAQQERQRLMRLERRQMERRRQYGSDRTRHVQYNGNDSYLITRQPNPSYTEGDMEYMNASQYQPPQKKRLTSEELYELPSVNYEGEPVKCSICLDMIEQNDNITYLVCFHFYHTDCIGSWLKQSIKCPICKTDIKAKLHSAHESQNLEHAKNKT